MKTQFQVTDLDGWLWYNRIEDMTKEELIGRLLRTEPANEKMLMGTAWHSVLENPPDELTTIEKDGFTFQVECNAEIILPQVREVRANKTYFVDGVEVTLTGKVDGITGNEIDDHKLTFNSNPENYMESYQWRAYLDIFNADVFKYIVYSAYDNGVITIRDIYPMKVYRYPQMIADLESGIRDLLGFVKEHVPEMIKA